MTRDATPADLEALVELEQACYPPRQAYSRAEYRYALQTARAVNLIEETGGAVVGFVGAFHHRAWRTGHVYTVNVHPSMRGRGLGKRLMKACEARLLDLGMTRVLLEVNVQNAAAIRLYESGGYRRMQRLKGYYTQYEDNDAFLYEKPIRRAPREPATTSR